MMQHEYEKEIRILKARISELEKINDTQFSLEIDLNQIKNRMIDLEFQIGSQYKQIQELYGQANTQDRKGSEERPKGHKKAS